MNTTESIADSIGVAADLLEESDNLMSHDFRASAFIAMQIEAVIAEALFETGSRVYGRCYATTSSDWDVYGIATQAETDRLLRLGWRWGNSKTSKHSMYKASVNFLVARDQDRLDQFHKATAACVNAQPINRQAAIAIWKECGL